MGENTYLKGYFHRIVKACFSIFNKNLNGKDTPKVIKE